MDPARLKELAGLATALPDQHPRPMSTDNELHIDGDYAAYYYSGNADTTLAQAKARMLDAFRVVQHLGGVGGRTIVHLTCGGCNKGGRYKIATVKDYQGHRSGDRPKNWEGMRAFLEAGILAPSMKIKMWNDREADDGVAVAAHYAYRQGKMPVIFSRDKDFRMIPGLHVVWTTYDRVVVPPGTFELIGPDDEVYGDKWFWLQMLQGDRADAIPGLEKVAAKKAGAWVNCGDTTALKMLAGTTNNAQAFDVVYRAYDAYYGDEGADRFVEQAALLWMRTDAKALPDDFRKVLPEMVPSLKDDIDKAIEAMKGRL